jgi:hypothetical protein
MKMNTTLPESLLHDIRKAYGSLEEPNCSFKEKRYRMEPYVELVNKFSQLGATQETTDLNDDASVVVFVGDDASEGVSVWLSLVGKYACFSNATGAFLSRSEIAHDNRVSKISDWVTEEGLVVLGSEELMQKIEFGGRLAPLHEILFTRDEAIGRVASM